MVANDRLNMVVVPTEVIWKWQQYGNNAIAIFRLSPLPSKIFLIHLLTIQSQAIEIKVTLNEMPFEQSVIYLSAYQEAAKWISFDWLSLSKRVIKWGSFNKTDFFYENNLSKSNKQK